MQHSSHPDVVDTLFPLDSLPLDLQEFICAHTATSFAVESHSTMRFWFPGVAWTDVQYVLRYEFQLMPRDLNSRPEIEVRVTRVLAPAFKQSRLFIESDVSMQEMLMNNFKEVVFCNVSGVKHDIHHGTGAPVPFIQFVSIEKGVENVRRTPFWSAIEQAKIEQVRVKLKSMFHMEFGN